MENFALSLEPATMEEATFTNSNKGKPILVDPRAYEYKKKSDLNSSKYWICRKSGCGVRAVTIHLEHQAARIKQIIGTHEHNTEKL